MTGADTDDMVIIPSFSFKRRKEEEPRECISPPLLLLRVTNLRHCFTLFGVVVVFVAGHSMAPVLWHASGSSFAAASHAFVFLLVLVLQPRSTTGESLNLFSLPLFTHYTLHPPRARVHSKSSSCDVNKLYHQQGQESRSAFSLMDRLTFTGSFFIPMLIEQT